MIDNIFERKYAQCLIARCPRDNGSKGEAVGMALVNPPSFDLARRYDTNVNSISSRTRHGSVNRDYTYAIILIVSDTADLVVA